MVVATEPKTMQKAMEISCALTDEAVRNGLIKKVKKRGNVGEPSKDMNDRDDNKRNRTGNAFVTTANPVRRENIGYLARKSRVVPMYVNPENVRNVLVNGNWVGCSYKEFSACNPKEYDGKGGVVVLTRWIEKIESVQDMSGCSTDQKVKYTAGSFVGKALMFHELDRLVPHLVTPESRKIERYVYGLALQICGMVAATEPKTMQKAVQISDTLTDEAVRNGLIKKVKKRGNVGE
nr:reverse transcriptase domain-containing protein [Tanacetum cinerariifolium]